MHESTPDTEAGRTLLLTKGWIQVKDGRQWGKDQQAYLVLAHQSLSILAASITRLKWSTPLWPAASPNIFVYRGKYNQPYEPLYHILLHPSQTSSPQLEPEEWKQCPCHLRMPFCRIPIVKLNASLCKQTGLELLSFASYLRQIRCCRIFAPPPTIWTPHPAILRINAPPVVQMILGIVCNYLWMINPFVKDSPGQRGFVHNRRSLCSDHGGITAWTILN